MPKKSGLPRGVTEFRDRHGVWRLRFRSKGKPDHYFTTRPGQDGWRDEYERCLAGSIQKDERVNPKAHPGSVAALIALYYQTPEFAGLAKSSQKTYRNVLDRFRLDHGGKKVATIERRHVKAILAGMSETPAAANKLLDKLRALFALAVDEGWRSDNPAQGVKGYRIKSEGFHTWTEDEIATYERTYPVGTKARLALDLLLYTGQRRSDAVGVGRQHFAKGRVRVRQIKTGAMVSIRVHPNLQRSIDAAPQDDMTLLRTEYGKPFTANGFGNKMREWCDAAGLPQCSSHGLRKAAARRLAEAGCTHAQIKAITGHTTDAEVSRYINAANQEVLADQAMDAIEGDNAVRQRAQKAVESQ